MFSLYYVNLYSGCFCTGLGGWDCGSDCTIDWSLLTFYFSGHLSIHEGTIDGSYMYAWHYLQIKRRSWIYFLPIFFYLVIEVIKIEF